MPLSQVNLIVRDPDASRAFYTALGLEFRRISPPQLGASFVSTSPGAVLALHAEDFAAWWGAPRGAGEPGATVLDFDLDSAAALAALVADLRGRGHAVVKEPESMEWGERFAIVLDPDGNAVGLKAPLDQSAVGA